MLNLMSGGVERWDIDLLEIRTNLRVVRGGSRGDDGDGNGVPILVDDRGGGIRTML